MGAALDEMEEETFLSATRRVGVIVSLLVGLVPINVNSFLECFGLVKR